MVQTLPRVSPQPQQRVHLVVEEAADPGGTDAGGLSLEVQYLPEHSAFPIKCSIAPRLARCDLVMGEHSQRVAGIGGDLLVTADEPRRAAQVGGDEEIERQFRWARFAPQPDGPQRRLQRRERVRVPNEYIQPGIESVHTMCEDREMHLSGRRPGAPGWHTGARQRRIEHGEKCVGANTRGGIKCDCAAPLAEDLRCGEITCGLFRGCVSDRYPFDRFSIQARLAGQPMYLLDIGPIDVIGAQSIGLAVPPRWRRWQFRGQRFACGNTQQAIRRLPFGGVLRTAIESEQCRDLSVAWRGEQARAPTQRGRSVAHRGDGVAAVVLAVAKRAHAIFPGFAPGYAREPNCHPVKLDRLVPSPATLERVVAAHVVIDARRKARHGAGHEIALGRMQVAARGIAAQRPGSIAVGFPSRNAQRQLEQNRDRFEAESLRRRQRAAAQRAIARLKGVRKQRQLDSHRAFIAAKRIRLIGPVETAGPRRIAVQAMLAALVVIGERVVGHGRDDISTPHDFDLCSPEVVPLQQFLPRNRKSR